MALIEQLTGNCGVGQGSFEAAGGTAVVVVEDIGIPEPPPPPIEFPDPCVPQIPEGPMWPAEPTSMGVVSSAEFVAASEAVTAGLLAQISSIALLVI